MVRVESVVQDILKVMEKVEQVRNIAIVAHVDHGKTTLTDSLLARAGLISKELAGEQRALDYEEEEQRRGITIKAANISLGFNYEGKTYIVNLIDTPGHVDFGGHVTRAMRAVDGIVLVVDAVEGVMPQTETVLRQALKEYAKPVLFINKIDRLINELKLSPEAMQERLGKIILKINRLIDTYAPKEFKEDWKLSVEKGTVAFGSAYYKWAISFPSMKRAGITFKEIYEKASAGDHAWLVEKSPVDEVILEMVINHLPDPRTAQAYRIPVIWRGDPDSPEGKAMRACDPEGPLVAVCFGVVYDPHAGEVGILRLFSGSLEKGKEVYQASKYAYSKVQQIAIYMGPDRVPADRVTAGNIAAVIGVRDLFVGETLSEKPIEPFEEIKHYAEPVVTKSIEAKDSRNLAKLIEILRTLAKEDPTLKVEINLETGEHLISGMGELHLEIVEHKIKERGIEVITSPPIVLFREKVTKRAGPVEGKSPNKHNRFSVVVEPLEEGVLKAILEGEISEGKPKGKDIVERLVKAGMPRDEAKGVMWIENACVLINATRGIQYMNEVEETLIQGFREAVNDGPLAREKMYGVKVKIVDATIHEDAVHRGPAQIIPAIKRPIYAASLMAGITLYEPKVDMTIQTPSDYSGAVINLCQSRRGNLLGMEQEGEVVNLKFRMPVAELFGFATALRSATQGRAVPYQEYAGYEPVPRDLVPKYVSQIRKRKGIPENPPKPEDFMD